MAIPENAERRHAVAVWRRLPRGVWALGLTSLLMDSSSELVHGVLPLFLTTVLGASVIGVGLVEGIAEATASFARVFSGALSDRFRRRKSIVVLGYALAAATKPFFALAPSLGWVLGARFVDRFGKGIRGAPRDALVAELAPEELRGAAFGLRQALDSAGALLGPTAALWLLAWLGGDLRAAMWVAVLPAVAAVVVLWRFVPDRRPGEAGARPPVRAPWAEATALPRRFWIAVTVAAVFALGRFGEGFLVLRAHELGLARELAPLVLVVQNAVYCALAYPAGRAADRLDGRRLLLGGLGAMVVADLLLAFAGTVPVALMGAALWGAHLALTQGLFAKMVADAAPEELRGTAFGLFHLATGAALLAASLLAGALWHRLGAPATFFAGAAFGALTAAVLAVPRARTA